MGPRSLRASGLIQLLNTHCSLSKYVKRREVALLVRGQQCGCMADDNEATPRPRDSDVEAAAVLNESNRACSNCFT